MPIFGLVACGSTTSDEKGATVQDVQDEDANQDYAYYGPYYGDFYDDIDSYDGETVVVSADVSKIIGDHAFTIAGHDVERLLVVDAKEKINLEMGSVIKVTGTVHTAFDLPKLEKETGVDLDDNLFAEFGKEPYIQATSIDTNPDAETASHHQHRGRESG